MVFLLGLRLLLLPFHTAEAQVLGLIPAPCHGHGRIVRLQGTTGQRAIVLSTLNCHRKFNGFCFINLIALGAFLPKAPKLQLLSGFLLDGKNRRIG